MTEIKLVVYAARSIPNGVRKAVMERDGLRCQHCTRPVFRRSATAPYRPDTLHLDHVKPWAAGGESTVDNLVVSCARCNLGRPKPTEIVRQNTLRVHENSGVYTWPDGYTPPMVADDRFTTSIDQLADILATRPTALLRMVGAGRVAATVTSPIRVEIPEGFRDFDPTVLATEGAARRVEDEAARAKSAELSRWIAERRKSRPLGKKGWQALIDARRLRERAA